MTSQPLAQRARQLIGPETRRRLGPRYRTVKKGVPVWTGLRLYQRMARAREGYQFGKDIALSANGGRPDSGPASPNPLETYFDGHREGRGIWKWRHYFELYDRYFSKFVGTDVRIVEIGIYSGGSLEMWKNYFGPKCQIYGVDIQEACRAYEDEQTKIFIGDQADPNFWSEFRERVPAVDLVVDDGGHAPDQQIGAFEGLFPHLRPGGVYICEDVGALHTPTVAYMSGLARNLYRPVPPGKPAAPFKAMVDGVHFHVGQIAIVKRDEPRSEFPDQRHGTQWQPFLGHSHLND